MFEYSIGLELSAFFDRMLLDRERSELPENYSIVRNDFVSYLSSISQRTIFLPYHGSRPYKCFRATEGEQWVFRFECQVCPIPSDINLFDFFPEHPIEDSTKDFGLFYLACDSPSLLHLFDHRRWQSLVLPVRRMFCSRFDPEKTGFRAGFSSSFVLQ